MVIIVMGVSGCGKSTVGQLLASKLHIPFKDADHLHPEENVDKMRSGVPLTDDDRIPWLINIRSSMKEWNKENGAVLACSALKKSYRDFLREGIKAEDITFVYLDGPQELISKRLQKREGHYMPSSLLDSQFDALEEPKNALKVSIDPNPEEIVNTILSSINEKISSDIT